MTLSVLIPYMLVMAGVTYLVRMLPMAFVKKKITSPFLLSFLHYIPYSVLAAMTFPSIFYCTGSVWSASAGTAAGIFMAFREKSLLTVAVSACAAALAVHLLISFCII